MADQRVEVLAVGAGPANLALAVAMEECAPVGLAEDTLLIEQYPDIKWQRNLLLPWARSQVSFLKDLVTLRNPCSRFSFLNFMHSQGRLDHFINMSTFHPYRTEVSEYLEWVADSLRHVRIRFGARCHTIRADRDATGALRGWRVTLTNGDTISCRDLVIGIGREPYVPEPFRQLPADRVVHSSGYRSAVERLPRDRPHRVAVIGGAQSAAEMFFSVRQDLPQSEATIILRSIGFQNYQTSKFVNELFYPSFVDDFFTAPPESRAEILHEMRLTNYAGLAPPFLDELYAIQYRQRMNGEKRSQILNLTEVTDAHLAGDEIVLSLRNRRTGEVNPLHCDLVLLGTGYQREMPGLIRRLGPELGLDDLTVDRTYRVRTTDRDRDSGVYLQGVNEDTHGIADSLISVLASRSEEIVTDLVGRRAEAALPTLAPTVGAR